VLYLQVSPGKGKVVPVLFLTEHHAIEAYWEWRYSSIHSLTSELDGGKWSTSHPGQFTPPAKESIVPIG